MDLPPMTRGMDLPQTTRGTGRTRVTRETDLTRVTREISLTRMTRGTSLTRVVRGISLTPRAIGTRHVPDHSVSPSQAAIVIKGHLAGRQLASCCVIEDRLAGHQAAVRKRGPATEARSAGVNDRVMSISTYTSISIPTNTSIINMPITARLTGLIRLIRLTRLTRLTPLTRPVGIATGDERAIESQTAPIVGDTSQWNRIILGASGRRRADDTLGSPLVAQKSRACQDRAGIRRFAVRFYTSPEIAASIRLAISSIIRAHR